MPVLAPSSRVLLRLIATASLFLALGCGARAAGGLTLDTFRPANMFAPDEQILLAVSGETRRVRWAVTDFFGTEVAAGEADLVAGEGVIAPALPGPGYYDVRVATDDETEARTAVAVMPLPPTATDSRFGVMTHFAQGWELDLVPIIAAAGIRQVRDELYWAAVESEPGSFVFPPAYEAYMTALRAHGIAPLIALTFANPNYDDGKTPFTDEGREAYARYTRAIVERYGEQAAGLEVWNEYNGSFVNGPAAEDRPRYYASMLETVDKTLDGIRGPTPLLGGATVSIPLPYLDRLFDLGSLRRMDGLAVHPYGGEAGLEDQLAALRDLIADHGGRADMPIWATEFGRWVADEQGRRDSARYLVRMAGLMLSAGVERMYWYLMRDYDQFVGMGLVRGPDDPMGRYAPAPALVAYGQLIRALSGVTFVRREPSDPRTYILLFSGGGREIRLAWSTSGIAELRIETAGPVSVTDLTGGRIEVRGQAVGVGLSANPIYIDGPVVALDERRADLLLASVDLDFGLIQGERGWLYGAIQADAPLQAGREQVYAPDALRLLEVGEDDWSRFWAAGDFGPLRIGGGGAHPGGFDGRPVWAVRRWTSPTAGMVRIAGAFSLAGSEGDGTGVAVLLDGREAFAADIGGEGPATAQFDLRVELAAGSRVDFVVTPGPAVDFNYDATGLEATITRRRRH